MVNLVPAAIKKKKCKEMKNGVFLKKKSFGYFQAFGLCSVTGPSNIVDDLLLDFDADIKGILKKTQQSTHADFTPHILIPSGLTF